MRSTSHIPAALVVVPLALLVAGCGLDTSEEVVGTGTVAAVRAGVVPGVSTTGTRGAGTTATSAPVAPLATAGLAPPPVPVAAASAPRYEHVPSVLGVPASAARMRIGASGFRVEYGRRYVVSAQRRRVATLALDRRGDRPVTAQSPIRPQPVERGVVVALGTVRSPVPGGRRPGLAPLGWRTVRFSRGVLELGGLRWTASCDRLDHVQLGPRGGATRGVRIWVQTQPVPPRGGCARRQPTTVRLRPGTGWERSTVAWDGELTVPRTDLERVKRVPHGAILVEPDRRTVMVGYEEGGCEHLAAASIAVRGRRATVDVRIGVPPPPSGVPADQVVCTADLRGRTTMVILPRQLPRRVLFADAR